MNTLKGKVAFVAGGARGIRAAIALREACLGRTPDTTKLTEIKGLPKGRPFFIAFRYRVGLTQMKVAETAADRTDSTTPTGLSQGKDVIPGR